jgi:tetratricopeptide (TPR) repeat protein
MLYRASLAVCFSVALFPLRCDAQLSVSSDTGHTRITNTIVQGTVLTAEGKPASGIRVEIDEPSTALPVGSTYTERDGSFELYNIPSGRYEVVAESKDALANPVSVESGELHLKLRLQRRSSPMDDLPPTVSVAQMMVPASAQKLYSKALADYREQKYDKAIKLLDEAIQIDSQFAAALSLRGYVQLCQAKLSDAQQDFEHAVQVDPNYSNAYVGLGAVYNHQGRFDDAMRASQRSLRLSPRSWQAYFEMAKASIAKGMYADGLQLARQAQRLSGNSFAAVHLIKAYALVPLHFYKDAKYELQAFLSRAPKGNNLEQAQTLLAEVEAALPGSLPAPR